MPDSVTVVVDSTLHAIFIPTPDNGHVPLTVDFNNLSRGNITQHWDFGDGTSSSDPHPQHLYKAAGNYVAKLTVTNARGCIDTMSFLIVVTNNFKIVIPNVFTPNADNSNDLYEVYATGIQQFSLHIFNRWGQELFVSDDPQKQWDGKSMGQEMPEAEYYYTLTVKDYLEEVHAYKGILTIIR